MQRQLDELNDWRKGQLAQQIDERIAAFYQEHGSMPGEQGDESDDAEDDEQEAEDEEDDDAQFYYSCGYVFMYIFRLDLILGLGYLVFWMMFGFGYIWI